MKDRLHQNISQYEQEIKIKEEIHLREKDNLTTQMKGQREELEKLKKEQGIKEKQLQEKISFLEKVRSIFLIMKYSKSEGSRTITLPL